MKKVQFWYQQQNSPVILYSFYPEPMGQQGHWCHRWFAVGKKPKWGNRVITSCRKQKVPCKELLPDSSASWQTTMYPPITLRLAVSQPQGFKLPPFPATQCSRTQTHTHTFAQDKHSDLAFTHSRGKCRDRQTHFFLQMPRGAAGLK